MRRISAAVGVLLAAVLATSALAAAPAAKVPTITPQDLKAALDKGKGPLVIDVRPFSEIESLGKIKGATVVSLDDVMTTTAYLPASKSAAIVVYSTDDRTASMVALALAQLLGYSDVKMLKGGFNAWDSLGYPYEEWAGPSAAPIAGGC